MLAVADHDAVCQKHRISPEKMVERTLVVRSVDGEGSCLAWKKRGRPDGGGRRLRRFGRRHRGRLGRVGLRWGRRGRIATARRQEQRPYSKGDMAHASPRRATQPPRDARSVRVFPINHQRYPPNRTRRILCGGTPPSVAIPAWVRGHRCGRAWHIGGQNRSSGPGRQSLPGRSQSRAGLFRRAPSVP